MNLSTENPKKALQTLEIAYSVFKATRRTRTFMTTARETLGEEMAARGIYAAHKIDFYKFMDNHFANIDSKLNAIALFGAEKVDKYLVVLNDIILQDEEMMLLATELKGKKDRKENVPVVAAQVAEALKEMKEETAVSEEAIKSVNETLEKIADRNGIELEKEETPVVKMQAAPKVDKPNYGLGFDLDSIMYNAALQFLAGENSEVLKFAQDKIKAELLKNTLVVLGSGANKTANVVKGRLHKDFKEVLEILTIEKQAFLGGAAGTGKTTLAAQVAEALDLPYGHVSCTAGMSEAHLLGRMVANGDYISARFVELYENGGVFLADEVDAADANTLLILNSALANGYISVPNRPANPTAYRHKDFYMICAGNTFGNGSNEYAGREIMDAAFMDRFAASKLHIDYDNDLEKEICREYPELYRTINKIRANVTKHRLRRVVSTRVFVSGVKQLSAGRTAKQFFDRFFTGWSIEEIKKAID